MTIVQNTTEEMLHTGTSITKVSLTLMFFFFFYQGIYMLVEKKGLFNLDARNNNLLLFICLL